MLRRVHSVSPEDRISVVNLFKSFDKEVSEYENAWLFIKAALTDRHWGSRHYTEFDDGYWNVLYCLKLLVKEKCKTNERMKEHLAERNCVIDCDIFV